MDRCYIDEEIRSIADLTDFFGKGLLITRINVPARHRGQGHGTALLKRILADADAEQVTLFLEILPSGPLSYWDLREWYLRHGFEVWRDGVLRRMPA